MTWSKATATWRDLGLAQEVEERADDPADRPDGLAPGPGRGWRAEVGAEELERAVDQMDLHSPTSRTPRRAGTPRPEAQVARVAPGEDESRRGRAADRAAATAWRRRGSPGASSGSQVDSVEGRGDRRPLHPGLVLRPRRRHADTGRTAPRSRRARSRPEVATGRPGGHDRGRVARRAPRRSALVAEARPPRASARSRRLTTCA